MRQSETSFSARSALFAFAAVFAASGCRCSSGGVGQNYGDLVVIWRDANGERITNRDATYDFGLTLGGQKKPMSLTIRNTGTGKLSLTKLELTEGDEVAFGTPGSLTSTSTSSFDVEFEQRELSPGEQRDFAMNFTPRALKESYLSKLLLTTQGTRLEDSTAVITLMGKSEKGACDLPSVIDFGPTAIGETLTAVVPYLNPTGLNATGLAGPISGTDASSFGYASSSPQGEVAVPAMSTTNVTLTFSPTELRDYEAQVVLRGAGNCPEKTVTLKGQGSNERFSWSPTSINFGAVPPGEEVIKEVTFINPAAVPVVLTQVKSSNPNDFYHVVPPGSDPTQFTVPGGSVPTAMKIACNPSQLGGRSGRLDFVTGLSQTPSGTISLSCTGGGPRIRVTPRPTLAFGRVGFFPGNPNYSVQRKVNVQNVGTRPPMPDPSANLYLGQVALDGTPGQLPLFELAAGAGTDATEFVVTLGSSYTASTGLTAVPGANFVDLTVTLKPLSEGPKAATLTIHSNDSAEPAITVNLTADVQTPPPCAYITSPADANFGLVAPGTQKDLPILITNTSLTPGEVCYLTGIELGAGSDPAYSIVGGNITEKELQPQEVFQVVVRVAPTGATPTTLQTLSGNLVFNSTSGSRPNAVIPLRTSVGPSCLTITPSPMDFGTVKVGCNSASRSFNIYNTCAAPITVKGFAMQAAGGQPAGGPNCPGATACPEFRLTATPAIPPAGLTINPGGSAPVVFQARYTPLDVGSDSGAIAISALQSGQSITYLVTLQGKGDTTGIQTDVYTQDLQPKADVLLVVDDSCSMQDKQLALGNNFNSFIQYALSANVDYQIGVTTTSEANVSWPPLTSKAPGGKLMLDSATGLKFVKPTTPDVSKVFARLVNVGTNGDVSERALSTAVMALTPPVVSGDNAGFLRPEANLAVVVVSDAADQSTQPVTYYQNLLVNVKGFQRLTYFTFNTIGPTLSGPPGGCEYDPVFGMARYSPIVNFTSGITDEICNSNWATALQKLGVTTFGYRTQFYLNNSPDTSAQPIVVKINGVSVPSGPSTWQYDSATNSIKFNPTATPEPGKPLEIIYSQACL